MRAFSTRVVEVKTFQYRAIGLKESWSENEHNGRKMRSRKVRKCSVSQKYACDINWAFKDSIWRNIRAQNCIMELNLGWSNRDRETEVQNTIWGEK